MAKKKTPEKILTLDDLVDSPFNGDGSLTPDLGEIKTVDGASKARFTRADVALVLYRGDTGGGWDGTESVVLLLKDERYVAWQTWWDATGSGFWMDAYGGDTDIWVGHDLKKLVLEALDDTGRELCGIPKKGL